MTSLIERIAVAICYGILTFIGVYILGAICIALGGTIAALDTFGKLLEQFAPLLALVAAVLTFLGNPAPFWRRGV